jgi:hypothetical protein
MDLIQWKPFREVSRLRNEMDRLWDDYFGSGRRALRPMEEDWMPAVDVSETGDKITIKAEVPGMEAKDIEIAMVGDTLTIKGEKKARARGEGRKLPHGGALLRLFHPGHEAAGDGGCGQGGGQLQKRRPDRGSAEKGRGEAQGHRDQG